MRGALGVEVPACLPRFCAAYWQGGACQRGMPVRARWCAPAVCQVQVCTRDGMLQSGTEQPEAVHTFTITLLRCRPFHGITRLQALDALHLDTCTGLDQAGDIISQLTKLTALEVSTSASRPSSTASLPCLSWLMATACCCAAEPMHPLPTCAACLPA